MTGQRFAVDVDELLRVVGEMAACEVALADLATDLERRMRVMQDSWKGQSALAQDAAMAQWQSGYEDMRLALEAMRSVTNTAHDNYRDAAEANVRMWGQVG